MLKVRCKVWLERDGRAVFGEGRARLLEAIAASGSLSAAARALRIPYRTAWQHVNAMEKGYGKKILRRQVGGAAGGGCRLTPAGAALLRGYQAIHEGLDGLLDQRLGRCLRPRPTGSLPACGGSSRCCTRV